MKKITMDRLDQLLERLAGARKLYLPVDTDEGAAFAPWAPGTAMSRALNTNRSAKDFFFPQTENLMRFKMEGKTIQVFDDRDAAEDFIIFGARACDVRSFEILDKVFLADPVDTYYQARREHGAVVALACARPAETCFCTAFGIDAADPAGDVSAWMDGEAMYFSANTDKGEALLALAGDLLTDGGQEEVAAQQQAARQVLDKLPLNSLSLAGFEPDKLLEVFDSDKWASLSEACLGCGTCTFVCPTCQCYDIRDFDTGHGVKRLRCWDSCMYSDFTKMAHGNPRLTQVERFRQRFMHKLVYFPANNGGQFGCVGCGRCLAKCPIGMNIVKVIKALGTKEEA
ncbi:MAG: 4Fe-4S dicluster domain-containing protein [Christensenellales bacterium]|jgi:sulfhydrogenase subunit beta (sulfur reductase)